MAPMPERHLRAAHGEHGTKIERHGLPGRHGGAVRRARTDPAVDEEKQPALPDDPRVMRSHPRRRENDVVVGCAADRYLFVAEVEGHPPRILASLP